MIKKTRDLLRGDGTKARALRGTGLTALHMAGGNAMRLASNLVLTRLLFPEAFGLMALVQVFIYGLQTFSEIGIHTMLIQNKREDPEFLNTLWTLQIIRGVFLWLLSCAVAVPAAWIYDQPMLAYLLPVTALAMLVRGFKTTREPQAIRVLKLEKVIPLQLGAQFAGLLVMSLLAWWLQSVWALAIGNVISAIITVVTLNVFLPGAPNRLCWNWDVVRESLNFGVFLLFTSMAVFFNNMGAQMILGAYVPIALFGIYNIARQLSALPGTLALTVARNVIFPLYRISPPAQSAQNQRNVFRARRLVALFAVGITSVVAVTGDWIVILLFEPTYELAGPMLVLMALALMPVHGFVGVPESLTGSGDSKRHFHLSFVQAILQVVILALVVPHMGVPAAILIPSLTLLAVYPYQAVLTHRYKAWDAVGEISIICLGLGLAGAIAWLKWDSLRPLFDGL